MKSKVSDNVLIVDIGANIDSNSADAINSQIEQTIINNIHDKLVLDFENVNYISSAGLRVVLSYSKKYKENFSVINANVEVYDIFSMTGFSSIMNVSKALRKISIEGAKIIGEGYTANVYRLNKDTIVKVFKINRPIERIQTEIDMAKKAFIYGIPTAISFDIVQVGDKYGLVFEMLDCASLCSLFIDHPENKETYIRKYAELCKQITTTKAVNSGLNNAKKASLRELGFLKGHIDDAIYAKLEKLITEVTDTETLVHGDYHIKNILVQGEDYMLIDMETICVGNPIFEYAGFYVSYIAYAETDHENIMNFFGISEELAAEIYNKTLNYLYPDASSEKMQEIREKIMLLGSVHILYHCYSYNELNEDRINAAYGHIKDYINKYDTLDL